MAVRIRIDSNARAVKRELRRLRRKGVFAAEKSMMDTGAVLLRKSLERQWQADMSPKKKSFPRTVLRSAKSFVNFRTGRLKSPARVFNVAADDLLRLQIRGGTRKAKGRALLIPPGGKRPRKGKRHSAGRFLWATRKRGPDRYIGVLEKSARIPRRWNIRAAIRRVERVMPRVARRALVKELNAVRSRL